MKRLVNYKIMKKTHTNLVHRPSPTFSVQSHDKWGSRYIWALDQLHRTHPPSNYLTMWFGKETPEQIRLFKKKLRESISNKKQKNNGKTFPYFGVFEVLRDRSIHAHVLVRNYQGGFFDEFFKRYNKKNFKNYSIKYDEPVQAIDGAAKYSFKLGSERKILFKKGSLSRYTISGGGYFPKGIKHYRELGRKEYYAKKNPGQIELSKEDCKMGWDLGFPKTGEYSE